VQRDHLGRRHHNQAAPKPMRMPTMICGSVAGNTTFTNGFVRETPKFSAARGGASHGVTPGVCTIIGCTGQI
jgi:hypothetical protein